MQKAPNWWVLNKFCTFIFQHLAIKNEQKDREQGSPIGDAGHSDMQITKYMRIIEELQAALGKEQQLRLLYEQKLIDLKTTLSTSLGFGSLPGGINLDRNESKFFNCLNVDI